MVEDCIGFELEAEYLTSVIDNIKSAVHVYNVYAIENGFLPIRVTIDFQLSNNEYAWNLYKVQRDDVEIVVLMRATLWEVGDYMDTTLSRAGLDYPSVFEY